MPRIYFPADLTLNATYELDSDNATHLIRVLRLNNGDPIDVFDGNGNEYSAVLCDVQKKSASFQVNELIRQEPQQALSLHLGQVVSKGDRMDFTIQKATELGITDRKSTRLNSSHVRISYAVFCLKKKKQQ